MFGGLEILPLDLKSDLLERISVFSHTYDEIQSIRRLLKDRYYIAYNDVNVTPVIVIDKYSYKELKKEIATIVPDCFHFEVCSFGFERIVAQYSKIDAYNVEHNIRETFVVESVLNGKYYIIMAYILTYDGKNNFYFRTADNMVDHFLQNDPELFKIKPIDLSIPPKQVTSIIHIYKE